MGNHMRNNRGNCPASALAPAESLALSQDKWAGGRRYQVHNSQWQREVGVSGSVQGPQDEWSGGGYLQEGGRSCVMPGLLRKDL